MIFNRILDIHSSQRLRNSAAPKIAVVGCGAIAEVYHLPALAKYRSVLDNLILVDMDADRLRQLAAKFNIRHCVKNYQEVLNQVDGVIVATPPHTHYPISMEFLARGIHVLCEKPLADTSIEARKLVAQAQKSGVTISVNHTRRLFPAYAEIKRLIAQGVLGKLVSIHYIDGKNFSWPTASGFYFNNGSRKGVLFDKGAHALDTICWWLGGKPKVVSSENDSFGGVEAMASTKLLYEDCEVELRFSWLAKLTNTFTVRGELGTICGGIEEWDKVTVNFNSGKNKVYKLKVKQRAYSEFGHQIVSNFIDIINNDARPLVDANEVIPSLELIEECYKMSKTFDMPWLHGWMKTNGH